MRGVRCAKSKLPLLSSFLPHTSPCPVRPNPALLPDRTIATSYSNSKHLCSYQFPVSPFSTSEFKHQIENPERNCSNNDYDDYDNDTDEYGSDKDGEEFSDGKALRVNNDEGFMRDVNSVIDILKGSGSDRVEMKNRIEQCGVRVSRELVSEVLSRVRNDWEAGFTFFLWAGKQDGYVHSLREYNSMISILGKMRKFDTAWTLIDEMRRLSILEPQTLVIMIRRYCAVHDVGRAVSAFYALKRFNFDVGVDEFHYLLSALCRYKNVQDAEHLMFCNGDVFPLSTKSFNIVLNGWCNAICSIREAERIWREMSKRGIKYDVVSYASIISCYSKTNNLYKVLKLYDRMKDTGIVPDRKVYNAIIFSLAKGRHVPEAMNFLRTMEEKGINPNTVTYNSLIKPLCKARKLDEAKSVFDEMVSRDLSPTIRTFHAFFRILRTGEEVFELLEKMIAMGCQPSCETYIMLIRKFCRWRQIDNVFKVWNEMKENGMSPDRSSYIVLIHGLFLNGMLEKAHVYYNEMKEKGLLPEPKIDGIIQTWLANKQIVDCNLVESKNGRFDTRTNVASRTNRNEKDFTRVAETRKVARERGFSLWD